MSNTLIYYVPHEIVGAAMHNFQKINLLQCYILVIAERCARSSTSMATWTSPPSSCVMQGGTGASYSFHDH